MRVILVRHAIAHERSRKRWPDDSLRPLTAEGARRFRKAARGLAPLVAARAAILTSPFVRARETARMLRGVMRRAPLIECAELAAGQSASAVFELLRKRRERCVVLVGHEPDLGRLLGAMLAGETARLPFEFKKGGAACVEFTRRVAPGGAQLMWMLPPKLLRALA